MRPSPSSDCAVILRSTGLSVVSHSSAASAALSEVYPTFTVRDVVRVSPVVSVTSALMLYAKTGSSFSDTVASGFAVNSTSKPPSSRVTLVP
jgi:hypothetical protein